MPGSGFLSGGRRHKSPPARRMSNRPKHACGTYGSDANVRQEQSLEGPAAFCQRPGPDPAAQPRYGGWHYQILKSAFELGRPGRSADPGSHIAPTAQEPSPATIIVVVGISAKATKAAAEMGDVMEAAQVTDSVESAADVADAVGACPPP